LCKIYWFWTNRTTIGGSTFLSTWTCWLFPF
jgi:hypothetical protein